MTISFPETISPSKLSDFHACEMRFKWAEIDRLVPSGGKKPVPMVDGFAFAKGLEVARRAFHEGRKQPDVAEAKGLRALLESYSEEFGPLGGNVMRPLYGYVDYLTHYPLATDYLQPAKFGKRSGVEFTFAVPLPINHPETGRPLLSTGRCDMVAAWRGGHFIVDEKTTGRLGPGWSESWELDHQPANYMWAAREHGLRILGTVIRGLSPHATGTPTEFAEAIIYHSEARAKAWLGWALDSIRRMLQCYKEKIWVMNRGFQCKIGGGCPYRFLCKQLVTGADPSTQFPLYETKRRKDKC